MLVHWDGKSLLFDCAEGTLRQFLYSRQSPLAISAIFITHLHGDHIFGLPSFLLHKSVAHMNFRKNVARVPDAHTDAIHVYGPEGLYNYLAMSLKVSRSHLMVPVVVHELAFSSINPSSSNRFDALKDPIAEIDSLQLGSPLTRKVLNSTDGTWTLPKIPKSQVGSIRIKAVGIQHTVPTVGYVLEEEAVQGSIDVAKATALGLKPGPLYKELKAGRDVTLEDGRVVKSADVVAEPEKCRKLVLLGDTCNASRIASHAKGADLLVHEATVEEGQDMKAVKIGHSTPRMAGAFAKLIGASRLVLTHFSARMDRGMFRPHEVHLTDWGPGPAQLQSPQGQRVPGDPGTGQLVLVAAKAFGSKAVAAAQDFLTVHIPRGGFKK
jgi:ribonuclease Z